MPRTYEVVASNDVPRQPRINLRKHRDRAKVVTLRLSIANGEKTMVRSLAERLRMHEQQKAKLADAGAKLKNAERKARTRRLIEVGALSEKAGLLDLNTDTFYGALLAIRDANQDQIDKWTAVGRCALAREVPVPDEGKEPIVLSFPTPLAKDAAMTLRSAGFRFNKLLQHWEGRAPYSEAQTLAMAHRGTARRIAIPVSEKPAAADVAR